MAGLYIHIPFCHSKCSYCDFYSMPDMSRAARYVDCLISEWRMRRNEVGDDISTVYIGGGTPSSLPVGLMTRLVGELGLTQSPVEFTVEANPEDVTSGWVEAIAGIGVQRVSIGIQSFVDDELREVGRRHSADDALKAVETLRRGGITEISCDLIYGLPLQTRQSWALSLDTLMSLRVPHFSAYSLSFEPGTRLYARLMAGKVSEASDDDIEWMYDRLISVARESGYDHYEISNFAMPGHRAVHNSGYWHSVPYIGLGAAAHSFDGECRRVNPANLRTYIDAVEARGIAFEVETESADERYNDYIITSLRTREGIDLTELANMFGAARAAEFDRTAARHIAAGRLIADAARVSLAENAVLVSDAVMRDLIVV